jgi:hypothetical protein
MTFETPLQLYFHIIWATKDETTTLVFDDPHMNTLFHRTAEDTQQLEDAMGRVNIDE